MKQRNFKKYDIVRPSKEWSNYKNNRNSMINYDPFRKREETDYTKYIGVVDEVSKLKTLASVRWFGEHNGLKVAWWEEWELDIIGNAIE